MSSSTPPPGRDDRGEQSGSGDYDGGSPQGGYPGQQGGGYPPPGGYQGGEYGQQGGYQGGGYSQPGGYQGGAYPQQGGYGGQGYSGQASSPYGPPPGYGGYDGSGGQYPGSPRNGMGIAAIVVAIISLLIAWIPFIGLVSVLGGIVGLVLGIIALGRVRRGEATNRGTSITAIVLSVLAILLAIGATIFGSFLVREWAPELFGPEFQECVETSGDDPAAFERCLEDAGLLGEYQQQQG